MIGSIVGNLQYYKLFSSPVPSNDVKPITNLLYGNRASTIFRDTVAKQMTTTLGKYLSAIESSSKQIVQEANHLSAISLHSNDSEKSLIADKNSGISSFASSTANDSTFNLKNKELTKSQVNQTQSISTYSKNFEPGRYTLSFVSGKESKEIQFNITAGDNNKDVVDKIASSINSSTSDIKALTYHNTNTGKSVLTVHSLNADLTGQFYFQNVEGDIVHSLGMNNQQQISRDLHGFMTDETFAFPKNDWSLEQGVVKHRFLKAEKQDDSISFMANENNLQKEIISFVATYNSLVQSTQNLGNTIKGLDWMQNSLSEFLPFKALEEVGIVKNPNMTLSISSTTFQSLKNTETSKLKSIFSEPTFVQDIVSRSEELKNIPHQVILDTLDKLLPTYALPTNRKQQNFTELFQGSLLDYIL